MLKFKKKPEFSAMNGLALLLAALLGLELHSALESPDYQALRTSFAATHPYGLHPGSSDNLTQSALAWRDVVLSRPLFDPSRRPPLAIAPAPAVPVEIPRLSGIMVTPTEKIAVFAPAAGDPIIVSDNGHFGPFTVLDITGDTVTIKGPDGVTMLRSDFSFQGTGTGSRHGQAILPGGINLSQISVPLPNAATWPGPPAIR